MWGTCEDLLRWVRVRLTEIRLEAGAVRRGKRSAEGSCELAAHTQGLGFWASLGYIVDPSPKQNKVHCLSSFTNKTLSNPACHTLRIKGRREIKRTMVWLGGDSRIKHRHHKYVGIAPLGIQNNRVSVLRTLGAKRTTQKRWTSVKRR